MERYLMLLSIILLHGCMLDTMPGEGSRVAQKHPVTGLQAVELPDAALESEPLQADD